MKSIRRNPRFQRAVMAVLIPAMMWWGPQAAFANPSGADVKFGDIQIHLDGDTMNILQNSNKSVINWDSFSIKGNESVNFQMPSSAAASLNRVTGKTASDIQGALRANGQLWLINPNGILFGGGAVIDVGGLMASTLDVADQDFLDGGAYRLAGDSLASVVNLGKIKVADGGEVVLAAHQLTNEGQILGGVDSRVLMISGHEALVHPGPNGNVIVSGVPASGITNKGVIEAGEIRFDAMSVYAKAVNNQGALRANKAVTGNGKVLLQVQGGGGIENSGTIEARKGDIGGEIVINTAGLFENHGTLDVSSSGKGGSINIGAGAVDLKQGSLLDASGGNQAGNIAVSTPGSAQVDGEIRVRSIGGKGGNVSLSANEIAIGEAGVVDVSGASGGVAAMSAMGGVNLDGSIKADGTTGAGGIVVVSSNAAMNVDGSIRASSEGAQGGSVKLTAADLNHNAGSEIEVDGKIGGTVRLDAAGNGRFGGLVSALGTDGKGGEVALTGNSVAVLSNAVVNANGNVGGNIYVGGGFQGNDARFRESIYTHVADSAMFSAKGLVGNGGNVVVWSNGATDFLGNIDVTGQVDGGLAEVSGIQSLGFAGVVDSRGATGKTGTLLLDPNNITLGSTGITAGALSLAVILNNVVIHTSGGNGQMGNITIEDGFDMRYSSDNSLSLFAHNDINVGGIIKNHGSGNINLFAGWDGTGAASFTPTGALGSGTYDAPGAIGAADIVSGTYGVWGTGGVGNINLNPNANSVVNIGSAGGETNLFGANVIMQGGDGDGEFAQIGYRPEEGTPRTTIPVGTGIYQTTVGNVAPTGDINVYTTKNLVMLSGANGRYVQIGHGGANNDDRMSGTDAWQIEVADVNMSGDITLRVGGVMIMSAVAGTDSGYVQVGHGGSAEPTGITTRDVDFRRIDTNASGNIDIEAQFLTMLGSTAAARGGWAHIGHGGYSVHGEHTGHIRVVTDFGILAQAGGATASSTDMSDNYVMIGHGGTGIQDNTTAAGNNQEIDRGSSHLFTLPVSLDGALPTAGEGISTVDRVNAALSGTNLSTNTLYDTLGELASYNTSLLREANLSATTGTYRKVGFAGNIHVEAKNGNIEFNSGNSRSFAQIGHGGGWSPGEYGGWDMDNADGDGDWATGTDGNIAVIAGGSIKMDQTIRGQNSAGQAVFDSNTEAFVHIGHGGYQSAGGGHGNITVNAKGGSVEMYGGRSNSFAMIGHGGRAADSGRMTAQGTHSGNINVNAASDIIMRSGFGHGGLAYSQIGHGGWRNNAMANEGHFGNISLTAGRDIDFYAGGKWDQLRPGQIQNENNANDAFTMVGHGGRESRGDHWGSITISAGRNISFEATGGWNAVGYADNPATVNSSLNLHNESGDTAITGTNSSGDESGIPTYSSGQNSSVTGARNFAMVGHGGYDSEHVLATTGSDSVGMGILGLLAGHRAGGATLAANDPNRVASNISISAGGDFSLIAPQKANQGVQSSLFLSYDADGAGTSDVAFVDPTTGLALPGAVEYAADGFAMVGHGGRSTEIRTGTLAGGMAAGHYGDVSVIAGGDVRVIASDFKRGIEAGTTGSPNTWVTGDSTGNAEYFDLAFWLDAQDGTIDGMDNSVRLPTSGFTHAPLGNLATLFPLYNHQFALQQMAIDAQDGVMTLGRFNYSRTTGPDSNFGTSDDVLTGGTLNMNQSLETNQNFAKIGHGGLDSTEGAMQGNITVKAGGSLDVVGGNSVRSFAQIGHGGDDGTLDRTQPVEGHITVEAGDDINIVGGDRTVAFAMIGHGGHSFNSATSLFTVRNADIKVTSHNGDINLTGGDFNARDVSGTTVVNNFAQFAKIGHGGWDMDMDVQGDITVLASKGSISLTGTKARANYAQIGHGAQFMDGGPVQGSAMSGNIKVDAYKDINLRGGDAPTYADLIAQNHDLEGQAIFPVNFYPDNEFSSTGTAGGQYSYAMIGHGGNVLGATVSGITRGVSISGNIDINTTAMARDSQGSINMQAGDGDGSFVLIGHGGTRNEGTETITGNITVHSMNDINITGGPRLFNSAAAGASYNAENFAQIGHAVQTKSVTQNLRTGNTSGNILVTAGDDITLQAGGGAAAHAKIGHGANFNWLVKNTIPGFANFQQGDHTGNITVVTGGDLNLLGATPFSADGNTQNQFGQYDPTIGAGLAGGVVSAAQIGHGGPGVASNAGGLTGNIDVRVGRNLTMTSTHTRDGYAKIGHGDYMFIDPSLSGGGFRGGDISVAVGGSAYLTGAQIGHVDDAKSNAITIDGDTYVAVGRNLGASGSVLSVKALGANPSLGFNSAIQSSLSSGLTGELRLYLNSRVQNLIASGTLLNDQAYLFPTVPPLRMDEAYAGEFGFTWANGLPTGSFTPNGTYTETALGRYTIFYGPVIGGNTPPAGGGGNPGGGVVNPGDGFNPGGGGNGGNNGGGVPPTVPPSVPLPPIPGLPPTLPPGGLSDLQLALIAAYFGGTIPAEYSFLLDPNYQNTTGYVNTSYSTESQFTVTSSPGVGSVNGGTPADGTLTIYGMDNGAPATGAFGNSEEDRRRRSRETAEETEATQPTTPAQPPVEAADEGDTATPEAGTPAAAPDPFSFQ